MKKCMYAELMLNTKNPKSHNTTNIIPVTNNTLVMLFYFCEVGIIRIGKLLHLSTFSETLPITIFSNHF